MNKFKLILKYIIIFLTMIVISLLANGIMEYTNRDNSVENVWFFARDQSIVFILSSLFFLGVLGCIILLTQSLLIGSSIFLGLVGIVAFANQQKMVFRGEPIFPEDLEVLKQIKLMSTMIGKTQFIFILMLIGFMLLVFIYRMLVVRYKYLKFWKINIVALIVSITPIFLFFSFNYSWNPIKKNLITM